MPSHDYEKLEEDFRCAKMAAAKAYAEASDFGTPNLDSVKLYLPRARSARVIEAAERAGLSCYKGGRAFWIGHHGLGMSFCGKSEAAIEAIFITLRERGWNVFHYQRMD